MYMKFLLRTLITAGALMIVAYVVPGLDVAGWVPAIVASVFLILANVFVRPILIVLTFPITILTLGLFIFVINTVILLFVASFVDGVQITNFVSAFIGSLLLSTISTVASKHL